jgi:hypothetical protein
MADSSYLFEQIFKGKFDPNLIGRKGPDALDWLQRQVAGAVGSRMKGGGEAAISAWLKESPERRVDTLSKNKIGSMYLFNYNATTKNKLPYWDQFPLIFPVDYQRSYFYGLNLHYLNYIDRAQLMFNLYSLANNSKYDDSTRLKLSYEFLKNTTRLKLFAPCFKKYKYSALISPFVYIHPFEWDYVLFLPLASWQGATQQEVWRASQKKVK